MAANFSSLPEADFARIAAEVDRHAGLADVLAWAAVKPKSDVHPRTVAEVITQDEFSHDIIVPYKNVFLVYDTT